MGNRLDIAECLNARLCHDLAGNIGAAASGTEFLVEATDEIRDKAAYLLQESTMRLSQILEFYRFTFSPAAPAMDADLETMRRICKNYVTNSRVTFSLPDECLYIKDVNICTHYVKIICCLSAILGNSLVHGGNVIVNITTDKQGQSITRLKGQSKVVRIGEAMLEVLQGDDVTQHSLSSKIIFAYYAKLIAQDLGKTIEANIQPDSVEFVII